MIELFRSGSPAVRPVRRSRPPSDDTGSMPMAMLLTLVGMALSGMLASMTLTHIHTSRNLLQRAHSLDAAQSGLEIGVAHIRAATTDVDGYATLTSLPCQVRGTVDGVSNSQARTPRYEVVISYFRADGTALACRPVEVPAYAVLRSVGLAAGDVKSRTLQAKYTLQTTNANISGGLILVGPAGTVPQLCLDADYPTTTQVRLQLCKDPDTDWRKRQLWAYHQNLTIILVSTKGANPMCLDTATIPHTDGQPVILRPCAAAGTTGAALYRQQWSYNDNANFEGTANGSTLDGFCLNAATQNSAGTPLVLGSTAQGTCRQTIWNSKQTFRPEASVGAGAAPASHNGWTQLANFEQFGRCIDVPSSSNPDYVTAWPCKQSPDATTVGGNQMWTWEPSGTPPRGRIRMYMWSGLNHLYPNGPDYCLHSPISTEMGQFVDVEVCDGGEAQRWAIIGEVSDSDKSKQENYDASYVIKDNCGRCLSPADPKANPREAFHTAGYEVSKIKVADCNGSLLQKWNAPPNLLQAKGLTEYAED